MRQLTDAEKQQLEGKIKKGTRTSADPSRKEPRPTGFF